MPQKIEQIKILIVEDESPMQDLVATVLAVVNENKIYKARNTAHAKVLCQAQSYDLVVVDLMIDPEGGIGLSKFLRESPQVPLNNNVPIIMMASYAESDVIEAAKSIKISDLLIKPFSFDDLAKHVDYVLKQHEMEGGE